jgi:hypothetical protein
MATGQAGAGPARVTVPRGGGRISFAAAAAAPVQRGTTDNFVVSYDSSLGDQGAALADAILGRCEDDFATLQGYFGGVTPPSLPFNVLVTTDSTGAYHDSCAGTDLFIGGQSATADNTAFIISLVVAEEDEVFEAAVGLGWDCGASNGEGLSRVLANDLYPGAEPQDFVSAPVWLDEPGRPDWVSQTEPTDQNYVSIGCSVLFLNWLRFQLGFSWQQVIAAGAPTLAEVYTNLTGRTDGFQRFAAQLEANFPSGTPSGLTTDQPYPLPGLPADSDQPS